LNSILPFLHTDLLMGLELCLLMLEVLLLVSAADLYSRFL
jgi:hypothetical protein